MKAEELSIGDWINVTNYHLDGSPYTGQVNGITKKHGTYYLQPQRVVTPITMKPRIGGDLSVLLLKGQSTGMDILIKMLKGY